MIFPGTAFNVNNFTGSPANVGYFDYPGNINSKVTIKGIDYGCVWVWNEQPHIYYNTQFGIMRIDSINGKNWTINK